MSVVDINRSIPSNNHESDVRMRDGDSDIDLWVELVCAGFQDDLPESSDGRQDHETHPKDDADLNIIKENTKKIRTKSR